MIEFRDIYDKTVCEWHYGEPLPEEFIKGRSAFFLVASDKEKEWLLRRMRETVREEILCVSQAQ